MQRLALLAALILLPCLAFAWNGHQATAGDLKVLVEEVPTVTEFEKPVPVFVALENTGNSELVGTARIGDLVDNTRTYGAANKSWRLGPAGKTRLEFAVRFGTGSYSALYPVHVYLDFTQGGQAMTAHAVRIVTTAFAAANETYPQPTEMTAVAAPERGALPLWTLGKQRVAWRYFDGPVQYKPSGWRGSDAVSRASVDFTTVNRGTSRPAITMHPTWNPGGGSVYCDYLLQLPATKPVKLTFATALRDSTASEPQSDGVLFRVLAGPPPGTSLQPLYENFHASKTWVPAEVDLSRFAGQQVLLRLESHPGPAKNTSCDQCYWAEPTVVVGAIPAEETRPFGDIAAENGQVGQRLLAGTLQPDGRLTFVVGTGNSRYAVVLSPSRRGMVDGVVTLVGRNSRVSFDGFGVQIANQNALKWPTVYSSRGYEIRRENGRAVHVHHLERSGVPVDLTLSFWTDGDGLRVKFDCPDRITDFALGAADQEAPAVYFGHGYRVLKPSAFRAGFGGHSLATSHVGFDFSSGLSVLQAYDVPPDYLEVDPDARRYALHTRGSGMLTLVAAETGAMDCALRYRPLYDKKPAAGVEKLAGRFCFDIWGGRYADVADQMEKMIRYGLTDSFLTKHVWQRWGYDYRLPDIWPPDPSLGTLEDMRRMGQVCRDAGVLWGLHDNYIDFYPDAADYTYDDLCFTQDGKPIKAWLNEGRDAQSYRWRPDRIMPFIERNLKLVRDNVAPTHYFLDVFTSTGCWDYYDHEGKFHPNTETRQKFGEAFAYIRDTLGDNAPTTSEAGHDQLIGYLDGADAQHLRLTSERGVQSTIRLECEDWERVPWYDAVNHSRFILHGVGYSNRYEGGLGRSDHGIMSDDYISDEILVGHALMADAGCWGTDAVRKYWLAQDVARGLALKDIVGFEYAAGDMHRQIVTWSDGTKVYVNRGTTDWSVEGRVLPGYGYLVKGPAATGGLMSAVERRDGVYSESTTGPSGWYCNARSFSVGSAARIEPQVENFTYLGGNQFRWDVVWKADAPAPRNLRIFNHFYNESAARKDKISFQDDHEPATPTSQWKGEIRYSRTVTVPADQAAGEYMAALGMYDSMGRLSLRGPSVPIADQAVWVGTLKVQRDADGITAITLAPPAGVKEIGPERMNPEGKVLDFGFAVTNGAFRVQKVATGLTVTPLPNSPAFGLTLRLSALGCRGMQVKGAQAVDAAGSRHEVRFNQQGDEVAMECDGSSFAYEIAL
ncbi:hypothetical protein LLH03_06155 [bacterium]|nr:hypothetical protein [bacterium]